MRKPRTETIVPFTAGDGFQCNLLHVTGERPATKGPVLLVHGAGVRANIFRAPVAPNLVDVLIDAGYDVWLENWRGSIDLARNEWTLDDAAVHDHPKAVQAVVNQTGARTIQAIVHCQGSTSFTMSAIAGLVPEVTTIVSNAVSLHPVVSMPSRVKLKTAVPVVGMLTPYIDAQWGERAPGAVPKLLTLVVRATHHECDNMVCRYSSFIYGTGFPVLWSHERLGPASHDWIRGEFGACPISFFRQMSRCVSAGHLVRYTDSPSLPGDFTAHAPETDARFAFFTGDRNRCFRPESQLRSYNYFNAYRAGYHSLDVIPDYGHLDMFIGENAARDVFPSILRRLD